MYKNLLDYLPEITYDFYKSQIKQPYDMFYIEYLQAVKSKIQSEFYSCLYNTLYPIAKECCLKANKQFDGKFLGAFETEFCPKIKRANIRRFRDAIVEDLITGEEDIRSEKDYAFNLEIPFTNKEFMGFTLLYFNSEFKDMGLDNKEREEEKITKYIYGESSSIPKEEQIFKLEYTMTKFVIDRMEDFLHREIVYRVYGYIYESGLHGNYKWLLDAVEERVRSQYYNIYYNRICNKYARNYNNPRKKDFAENPTKYIGTGTKSVEFAPVETYTCDLDLRQITDEEAAKRDLVIPPTCIFSRDNGHVGKVVYTAGKIIIRDLLYNYFLPLRTQIVDMFDIPSRRVDTCYNDFIDKVYEMEFDRQMPHFYSKIKELLVECKIPINDYCMIYDNFDPMVISKLQPFLQPTIEHDDLVKLVSCYDPSSSSRNEHKSNNESKTITFKDWKEYRKRKAVEILDTMSWQYKVPVPDELRKKLAWYVTLYEYPSRVCSEGIKIIGSKFEYSFEFEDMIKEYLGVINRDNLQARDTLKDFIKESIRAIYNKNPNIEEFRYYEFIDVMANYYYRDALKANLLNPKYSLAGRLMISLPFTPKTLKADITKVRNEIAKYEPKSIEECITISAFLYNGFIE